MIQISGGKSALWWEQKRQMSGGKCDKLGGGKSDKGKWTTAVRKCGHWAWLEAENKLATFAKSSFMGAFNSAAPAVLHHLEGDFSNVANLLSIFKRS